MNPDRGNAFPNQSQSVTLWMPWFIKEHRANASTLSHVEHSALCYLNMMLWEHGGQIPNDDKFLARHLRLSVKQWKGMRDTLLHHCTVAGNVISHPGLIAEFAKAQANQEQKRKAGQASAAARKAQREGNGCSTGVTTAVQPRAGSGEGDGPIQRDSSGGEGIGDTPFRVVKGGN
jgi:uncharacterized protein YdaU (DUF1376 family)